MNTTMWYLCQKCGGEGVTICRWKCKTLAMCVVVAGTGL
jgi:hypothetical protein